MVVLLLSVFGKTMVQQKLWIKEKKQDTNYFCFYIQISTLWASHQSHLPFSDITLHEPRCMQHAVIS